MPSSAWMGRLVLAALCARAAPAAGQDAAAIDSIARAAVARGEAVGVSVAVLRGGEPVRIGGYGMADLESAAPATDSTRYYLGSITKTVTAAAVLRLAQAGKLGLDDDLAEHVPELGLEGRGITLRHLLRHTAGLPTPQDVGPRFLERRHLEFTRAQLLELLQGQGVTGRAGTRWEYNNLGYIVLGIVVERASGLPYEDFVRDSVLAPGGAAGVRMCDTRRVIPRRAQGYEVRGDTVLNHEPVNASLVFAAGGLCAQAPEVAAWFRALARGGVIGREGWREMTTRGTLADGSTLQYGYGMFVDSVGTHPRMQHAGDVNGFSAQAAWYPDDDVTVVVLTNTRGPVARRIEREIARRMLGIPPPRPVSAAEGAALVGSYEAGFTRIDVVEEDGWLAVRQSGRRPMALVRLAEGGFGVQEEPALRLDFAPAEGRAAGLVVTQLGRSVRLERVR